MVFLLNRIFCLSVRELDAIQYVIDQIDAMKVVRPPDEVHIEGGDVMLWDDHIFIGTYKVITKTISQQEQIGRSPIYKRVVSA
jgi:arginine deiminase